MIINLINVRGILKSKASNKVYGWSVEIIVSGLIGTVYFRSEMYKLKKIFRITYVCSRIYKHRSLK